MLKDRLQGILERWKRAFGQYDQLRAAASAAVVRWEWADGERHSHLPFYFNRYPGRARAMKAPPDSAGYYIRYGFDDQNRLRWHWFYDYLDLHGKNRLARDQIHGFERDDLSETFYTYSETLIEIVEFSVPPRIPLRVQQIACEEDRVTHHVSFRLNGYTPLYSQKGRDPDALYEWLGPNGRFQVAEEYIYEGERLMRIHLYSEQPGAAPFEAEEIFTYDEGGKLLEIERHDQRGARHLLYRKRKKGQTFRSIRQTATERMIAAITERLRAENIRDPLCCLELSYQSASHHFPPGVLPGREADRRRLLDSGRPDAHHFVFAPALLGPVQHLEINDPETLDLCQQLEQEIQRNRQWDTATAILRDVAAALTRQDWTGILNVTPDFVAFAIDWEMEGDQLAEVLGASAPQDQIREWQAKGWL